jgi:pilus assembly protein Flp/PilA
VILLRHYADEVAATAVEYAVMVALIAAVIVLSVVAIGNQTREAYCDTSSAMEVAAPDTDVSGRGC